jgi:hypothetical protein
VQLMKYKIIIFVSTRVTGRVGEKIAHKETQLIFDEIITYKSFFRGKKYSRKVCFFCDFQKTVHSKQSPNG